MWPTVDRRHFNAVVLEYRVGRRIRAVQNLFGLELFRRQRWSPSGKKIQVLKVARKERTAALRSHNLRFPVRSVLQTRSDPITLTTIIWLFLIRSCENGIKLNKMSTSSSHISYSPSGDYFSTRVTTNVRQPSDGKKAQYACTKIIAGQ